MKPQTNTWQWQGFHIHYQSAGTQGPAVVLIHGFGASSAHWRKNIADLAATNRVYALDLLGFGGSDKPKPGPLQPGQTAEYIFETWGQQVIDFCKEVAGGPAFLVGNSIGCIVALQAAVIDPSQILGVSMLDCSLRLLHERKRLEIPWYRRLAAPILQSVLSYPLLGEAFFKGVAQPKAVRKILRQAYGRKDAVTDELIELLLGPAFEAGAPAVFLAFIQYSQGPLPEDLLPQVTCPVLMLWGQEDPWEPIEQGRQLAKFPTVEDFIALEGVGHCPQDEAPEVVNPLLINWIAKHSGDESSINNVISVIDERIFEKY
ncbi:MAG: alpha/beta fold hydrolase [Thermosynechococcaceae cyanobacterium]